MTPGVLSLGAGVQSTALLLMSEDGTVPPFDAAVFADTGDEPAAVYEHLDRLDAATRTPIHRVRRQGGETLGEHSARSTFSPVPLYDGKGGMGKRQCTYQFKIRAIRAACRTLQPTRSTVVDLAQGITVDEIGRAKDANVKWLRHTFPLLDLGLHRSDCERWLADRGWDAPRSACAYCPYRTDREWAEMRDTDPETWAAAVAFDEANRHHGYVHARGPLASVPLIPEDGGQLTLAAVCEGMCGL